VAVNLLFDPTSTDEARITALDAERVKLQAELLEGKVLTEINSGEVGSNSAVEISIKERLAIVLAELCRLDPETYPPSQCIRTSRTRIIAYQGTQSE
jgi:hypothetical protein